MKFRVVTCMALLVACVGHASSLAATVAPRTQTLDNGLKLILAPDSRAAGVDVALWYEAGALWEERGKTGLTHVLEQLMFRGPEESAAGSFLKRIQSEGGVAGTHTTHDFSSFYETVPPEALEGVFQLEADRMTSLVATQQDLENVRTLVDMGRQRATATPVARGLLELFATAFAGHPYGRPAIGLAEDLSSIGIEDCRAYHASHYSPATTVVTVVGRFDPGDVVAAARKTLGAVPRRKAASGAPPALAAQTAERRASGTYEFPAASLLIGWRTPGGDSKDIVALDAATRILAARSDSRLNRALVGVNPDVAFIQGGFEVRRQGGLMYVLVVLSPGADTSAVPQVEAEVLARVQTFLDEPVTDEEVEAVRREMESAMWYGRQRPRDQAMALGSAYFLAGDLKHAGERVKKLERLRAADISAAARRHIGEKNRTLVRMHSSEATGQGVSR